MDSINKLRIIFVAALITTIFSLSAFAADLNSPVGYWRTIDDKSGQVKSIVQIYKTSSQTLGGRVIKIFPPPGEDQTKVCDACKGSKHNQRIVGMVFLEGARQNGDVWDNCRILDPDNGKTYSCTLKLINNGRNLQVRGFIGIQLLGRTQTWTRANK